MVVVWLLLSAVDDIVAFVFVVVPIACNAINALYEFFVLVLVLVLVPTGCRFCVVGVIVLLFELFDLDGVDVVNSDCRTVICAIDVVVGFGLYFLVSASVITGTVDCDVRAVGVIFVVVFIGVVCSVVSVVVFDVVVVAGVGDLYLLALPLSDFPVSSSVITGAVSCGAIIVICVVVLVDR